MFARLVLDDELNSLAGRVLAAAKTGPIAPSLAALYAVRLAALAHPARELRLAARLAGRPEGDQVELPEQLHSTAMALACQINQGTYEGASAEALDELRGLSFSLLEHADTARDLVATLRSAGSSR
jgi:hypothetical protein